MHVLQERAAGIPGDLWLSWKMHPREAVKAGQLLLGLLCGPGESCPEPGWWLHPCLAARGGKGSPQSQPSGAQGLCPAAPNGWGTETNTTCSPGHKEVTAQLQVTKAMLR